MKCIIAFSMLILYNTCCNMCEDLSSNYKATAHYYITNKTDELIEVRPYPNYSNIHNPEFCELILELQPDSTLCYFIDTYDEHLGKGAQFEFSSQYVTLESPWKLLKKWKPEEKNMAGRQFYNQQYWTLDTLPTDTARNDDDTYRYTFEILPEDIETAE